MSKILVDLVKKDILDGHITEDTIFACRALQKTDPDVYNATDAIKMVAGMVNPPSEQDAEYARQEMLAEEFEQAKGKTKDGSNTKRSK